MVNVDLAGIEPTTSRFYVMQCDVCQFWGLECEWDANELHGINWTTTFDFTHQKGCGYTPSRQILAAV